MPRNTSPITEAAPLATLHGPGLANGALISAFNPGESFDILRRLRRLSPSVDEGEGEDEDGVGADGVVDNEALAASTSGCCGCCGCPFSERNGNFTSPGIFSPSKSLL
jgi:hypothetical protein